MPARFRKPVKDNFEAIERAGMDRQEGLIQTYKSSGGTCQTGWRGSAFVGVSALTLAIVFASAFINGAKAEQTDPVPQPTTIEITPQ